LGRILEAAYARIPFDLLDRLAARPGLAAITAGLLAFFGSALVGLIAGLPLPIVHDEFAYLLQADTFVHGRVANPAHPMWQHFETFHILWQPTYASKYPPAQGLVLALGQVLGHPVIGVWISAGLMCAALTWMLFAWVPRRWAVVGGILVAAQLGMVSYWTQSYWGGAVAAAGGALLFGATRRLVEDPRLRDGLVLGLGLVILATSRPFEGFLVSLPAAAVLAWAVIRSRTAPILAALAVTLAVLVLSSLGIGYYNHRVTGDALTMPQAAYNRTYALTPNFFWQEPPDLPDRKFRHAEFEEFFRGYALERYEEMRDPSTFLLRSIGKLITIPLFFLGPGVLALFRLRKALRDHWIQLAAGVSLGLLLVELFTNTWPHYLAPATCLVFVVMIACLRTLHETSTRHLEGRRMVLLIVVFFALSLPVRVLTLAAHEARSLASFARQREDVVETLLRHPGRDLVIVHYGQDHNVHEEWVFNEADIDGAEIVWARDMGGRNGEIIAYFPQRRVWHLRVDREPRLQPIRGSDR
jgi:hypothetical protein